MQITPTLPIDGKVSVGTSAVKVLSQVPEGQTRTEFSIQNTSTGSQKMNLRYGQPAILGEGTQIIVGAGVYASIDSASKPWQGEIWAIGDGASGEIAFHELRA